MAYPKGLPVTPDLRKRLQAVLKSRGVAQEYAASTMKISRQLLNEVLHGKKRVSMATMRRLLNWLGSEGVAQS